jgi:hypothetical protein
MPPLDRTLRRNLENAVKAARRVAERAATKALDSLAVGNHEPWSGQPTADRALRETITHAHFNEAWILAGDP